MPKSSKTTPLLVIIAAVLVAGGLAIYLSRQSTNAEARELPDVAAAAQAAQSSSLRVRGAADAPVTLVEYGDYQCPTCGKYHPILQELLSRYPGKLKLEFRHYPLIQIHPNALGAALAAESAGDQGKFWEMNDLLFERQQEWSPNPNAEALFLQYALQLGLDGNRFMQSIRSPATRDRVLADVSSGNAVVQGTPTFLINGQLLTDLPGLEGLSERVDRQLAALGK